MSQCFKTENHSHAVSNKFVLVLQYIEQTSKLNTELNKEIKDKLGIIVISIIFFDFTLILDIMC